MDSDDKFALILVSVILFGTFGGIFGLTWLMQNWAQVNSFICHTFSRAGAC